MSKTTRGKKRTMRLNAQTYFVHESDGYQWKILVKQDNNSGIYTPVYRKGWQDGGEVEIFTLLPPAEVGDMPLIHIRIYTKANTTDRVPGVPNPMISVQGHVPIFTLIEPTHQRVLVELLCSIVQEGHRLRITPLLEDDLTQ